MPLARPVKPKGSSSRRCCRPPRRTEAKGGPATREAAPARAAFARKPAYSYRIDGCAASGRETLAKSKAAQQSAAWTASLIPLQEKPTLVIVGLVTDGSTELVHVFGTQRLKPHCSPKHKQCSHKNGP